MRLKIKFSSRRKPEPGSYGVLEPMLTLIMSGFGHIACNFEGVGMLA